MSDLNAIRRRWSTHHERGADDYTDEGCRVLAEHAFRDVAALLDAIDQHDAGREIGECPQPIAYYDALNNTTDQPSGAADE